MGHARALLGIDSHEGQLLALHKVLLDDLSVRATEKLVKSYQKPSKEVSKAPIDRLTPLHREVTDHLSKRLGTRVEMQRKASGAGKLITNFSSDDELNDILDTLEGN